MLATLPSAGDLPTEQLLSSSAREATTALATAMHASQPDVGALEANKFAIAEDNPHVFT